MSNLANQLTEIDKQVDAIVKFYNDKQQLTNSNLQQIRNIQKKLDNIISQKQEQEQQMQPENLVQQEEQRQQEQQEQQVSPAKSLFSRFNPFTKNGGRYSHKRRTSKRRSTKKGGRKRK